MKLRELLNIIENVAKINKISIPYICGGAVRERLMESLKNNLNDIKNKLSDIDITNGESSIKNLAKEVEIELAKKFSITAKTMSDGHTSLFLGGKSTKPSLKIDFSSNFIIPNIDQELAKLGIKNITNMMREVYSRDFYCNSLLMSFDLKKVIDPTHQGIKDIKNKLIRTCLPPEITLGYNKNRIIRAIYLSAKLDFNIDPSIINFISNNKNLISDIDPGYLSKTLNKAIKYNIDKTAKTLDELDLWKSLPIPEALYPQYKQRFSSKQAQLRKNFDYGEGFYSNLQDEKSVAGFRKKRKKKQKKDIKKIKEMKLAYYNGADEYMKDNFPIVENDDLETSMDRQENKSKDGKKENEEESKDEECESGETSLEPTPYSPDMFYAMHGTNGLLSTPLAAYPGHLGEEETEGVVNNPYNPIFQSNGLFESRAIEETADLFVKLSIK